MPLWKSMEKFLLNDGWIFAAKNSGADRVYYKTLDDGTRWRTRVSKGSEEIGKNLFSEILKKQLYCSKTYFNKVLSDKKHSSDDLSVRNRTK